MKLHSAGHRDELNRVLNLPAKRFCLEKKKACSCYEVCERLCNAFWFHVKVMNISCTHLADERMASSTSLNIPFSHQTKTLFVVFHFRKISENQGYILHRWVDADIKLYIIEKVCICSCDIVMTQNLSTYFRCNFIVQWISNVRPLLQVSVYLLDSFCHQMVVVHI